MFEDEIEVPKELQEFMLEEAEEIFLGQKNGVLKQYSYGNLYIREYNVKFLVHNDKIYPRKDLMRHLIYDALEVLIETACVIFGGSQITKKVFNKNSKKLLITSGLFSLIIFGYMGYLITKKIKTYLE